MVKWLFGDSYEFYLLALWYAIISCLFHYSKAITTKKSHTLVWPCAAMCALVLSWGTAQQQPLWHVCQLQASRTRVSPRGAGSLLPRLWHQYLVQWRETKQISNKSKQNKKCPSQVPRNRRLPGNSGDDDLTGKPVEACLASGRIPRLSNEQDEPALNTEGGSRVNQAASFLVDNIQIQRNWWLFFHIPLYGASE